MNAMHSIDRRRGCGGFSLLEILVAITILALSLAALYQATSGATRNVRTDEKYAYAVELARSLLTNYSVVPTSGVDLSGETGGGYQWQVFSQPIDLSRSSLKMGSLHTIEVTVSWDDGSRRREVSLDSVVEGGLL